VEGHDQKNVFPSLCAGSVPPPPLWNSFRHLWCLQCSPDFLAGFQGQLLREVGIMEKERDKRERKGELPLLAPFWNPKYVHVTICNPKLRYLSYPEHRLDLEDTTAFPGANVVPQFRRWYFEAELGTVFFGGFSIPLVCRELCCCEIRQDTTRGYCMGAVPQQKHSLLNL